MKFTSRTIEALKPKPERYEAWEDNGKGFGLRVAPSGRKSWLYMYRYSGKARRMTLGNLSTMGLADAHEAHAKARKLLEKGIDPGEKQVEANQEARNALTISQLVDEYMEKWAKPRKRSWKQDKGILDKDVLPKWKRHKARDITRRDVIILLDSIVDRGAPITANKTLAVIRKMFNFAISRDIIDASPCAAILAPSKVSQRDRILTSEEIKAFWEKLSTTKMADTTKLALKLQLVTAQRRGEVATMAWDDLDIDSGWWTIPTERSKNKLPHRVPLSEQAIQILDELRELNPESDWAVPSPHGDKPITPGCISRALMKNLDVLGISNFTPHDLRRTAASQMTAMGISRLVASKLLNHVESGITAVYDRHSYDQEKRYALDAWGRKLDTIIKGKDKDEKVVELKRA